MYSSNHKFSCIKAVFEASCSVVFCPYLAVEDVLGRPLLVFQVPDQSYSIGLVGSILVVVVRGHQKLWILWRNMAAICKYMEEAVGKMVGRKMIKRCCSSALTHLGGPVQTGDHSVLSPALI